MNKHLITTLLLFILFVSISQAQNAIGFKGGISIPNLTADGSQQNPINSGYSSRLGPDFTLFNESKISKDIFLVAQLEYSSQGGKKDGLQAISTADIPGIDQYFTAQQRPVPTYVYANFNSEAKLNYLMLDALTKMYWKLGHGNCSFYLDAGPFGALLVSAHQVTSGISDIYADQKMQENITELTQQGKQSFDNNQDIKDSLHTGNFGIEGDIGLAFSFGNSKLFIEGGGNYGFINIQKGSDNGKSNIGAATIRIGYAFKFGK